MDNTKSIRASDETMNRFRAIAKESGMSQGDALEAMMSAYELAMSTQAYPAVQDDIQAFERGVNLLFQLYSAAIKTSQTQRELAVAEVRRHLDSKDCTIQDLQEQLANTKDALKRAANLEAQLDDAKNRLATVMDELTSLRMIVKSMPDAEAVKSQESIISELRQKVAALESQVAEKSMTIELLTAITQQRSSESTATI